MSAPIYTISGLVERRLLLSDVLTGPDGLKTAWVGVTPDLAKEWLTQNTSNRTINAKSLSRTVHTMQTGGWRVSHQGIAFLQDGTLADGQHRLESIVRSGVSIVLMVTWGMDRAQRAAVDMGNRRKGFV